MTTQIVGAFFNACWQGLAIVAVAALALRMIPRSSAASRYATWFAALIAVAALPAIDLGVARLSTAIVLSPPPAAVHFDIVQTGTVTYADSSVRESAHRSTSASSHVPTTVIGYAVESAPDRLTRFLAWVNALDSAAGAALGAGAPTIMLAWIALCVLLLARLATSYVRLRRVKRAVMPLDDPRIQRIVAGSKRPVTVGLAEDLTMPCVLGFARPVIALPAKLAAELTDADLERIVRHEHAHVRRWDDVANALQLVVQAVMCMNPAVYIIGRNLDVEREIACDDFAVEPLAERVQYAKCLTHIAVTGFGGRRPLPAPGFFFNRKQLLVRVERLLERGHNGSTAIGKTARFGLVGLALAALIVARIQVPVVAASVDAPSGAVFVPASVVVPATIVAQTARAAAHIATERTVTLRHTIVHAIRGAVAAPHPSAVPALARKAQVWKSFGAFASHRSGGDFLDALAAAGYPPLSVDNLIRLKNIGVSADLINAAIHYSGSRPSVETLLRLAAVGVDADFLTALANSGRPHMSLDDVVRVRSIGADPAYMHAMDSAFGAALPVATLIRLRALGVDRDYVASFRALGYDRLTPDDSMRLRAVGVDAAYVRMLRSKGIGAKTSISVDDLVRMKSVGLE